jgi:formate hydrogenlyase subunit 3/multisubunit Na+/H+ antiporter MnhD subunit
MILSWLNTEAFLLVLLLIFPIFSWALFSYVHNYQNNLATWFGNFYYKLAPFLCLIILINLLITAYPQFSLVNIGFNVGLGLFFGLDKIGIGFLLAINFIWLLFAFYSAQLFKIQKQYLSFIWQKFFLLLISLLFFLFCSQSLITVFFFYQLLLLFSHYVLKKNCSSYREKNIGSFDLLFYLQIFLFFLAIVLLYQHNQNLLFLTSEAVANNLNENYLLIVLLLMLGLFLVILSPSFLLLQKLNLDIFWLFLWLFFGYSLPSLFIFSKVLNYFFGWQGLLFLLKNLQLNWFIIVFIIYFIALNILLNMVKNLQSWYLIFFWQQLNFLILTIILHNLANFDYIYLSITGFVLLFLLLFFTINNIKLYHQYHNLHNYQGLFYKMPITSLLFLFAIAMAIGVVPSIAMIDKIFLIKTLLNQKIFLALIIIAINTFSLGFSMFKFSKIFFINLQELKNFSAQNNTLDFDVYLVLIPLVIALISVLGMIFYPIIYNVFI